MPSPGDGHLVCIGFMAAGKTTAARSAAARLEADAIDVDALIEKRLGKPIASVFAQDGEAAFRSAEEEITLELLRSPGTSVLALGGGAISHASVREALSGHLVVWLDVPLDVAWERVQGSGRPLAREWSTFARLYREREPIYQSLADVVVPSARSEAMADVLRSLQEVPPGTTVLWAASAR